MFPSLFLITELHHDSIDLVLFISPKYLEFLLFIAPGHSTFKEIARSSTHTILAACGLEHKKSEVCAVPPPDVCAHIELMAGGQTSLIKGCCSSCFDSFVRDVVKRILDTKMSSQWLRLGL